MEADQAALDGANVQLQAELEALRATAAQFSTTRWVIGALLERTKPVELGEAEAAVAAAQKTVDGAKDTCRLSAAALGERMAALDGPKVRPLSPELPARRAEGRRVRVDSVGGSLVEEGAHGG